MTESVRPAPSANEPQTHLHEHLLVGLDWLDQGLTLFDTDLRLMAWNRRFLQLLDFPESLPKVGTPFEAFIRHNALHGEYGEGDAEQRVRLIVEQARAVLTDQTEWVRPNGRILKLHGEFLPELGYITLYTDITEQRALEQVVQQHHAQLEDSVRRRTAELEAANARLREASEINSQMTAALQRSEERLRLMTDTIPALIAYFDHEQVYRYANRGYADWFGRRNEHIVGHHIEAALGIKFYAAVKSYVEQALTGERVTYEYSMEKEDGSTIFARSTLVPEVSPEGKVLGCFVLSFDITEQKHTQAALVQAQKMEAVGQLAGGLAHDFNNMLTVVIGNLAELQNRCGQDPQVTEFLEPALHAAERGVELIKRLLSFSRQQPLEPKTVQIGGLILGMMKLLRRSLPENITMNTALGETPLYATVDPHQLESAILNLVLNARDAMPEGGELLIEATRHPLTEEEAQDCQMQVGEYIRISVRDNGTGIDPTIQMRVFEPFFTTKRFGSGSGLGLAMVYGFVQQSGGGIRLDSQLGKGTVVSLFLPCADEESVPTGRLNFSGRAGGRDKPLVLLTEDDPEVRRIVRLQLTGLGYPVLEAENGDEAAAMVENIAEIGLLLSDVVMPGQLNGRTLADFARRHRPHLRVVLMSGHAAGSSVSHPSLQAVPILEKPFTQEQLSQVLDEVIMCQRPL